MNVHRIKYDGGVPSAMIVMEIGTVSLQEHLIT